MNIDELFDKILSINWFSNCGNTLNQNIKFNIVYVPNWNECKKYYSDISWEDTTLEARNRLTEFLYNKYPKDYENWNVIAEKGKTFLNNNVIPKINEYKDNNNMDKTFVDCIEWDLLGAIMEASYSNCKNRPEFFLELLKVYEAGNFPCGWIGEWPEGKLIVY